MSSGTLAVRGRVQRESGVTHFIADRLHDLTDLMREVGEMDGPLPVRRGRGDEAKAGGSPDHREKGGLQDRRVRDIYIPDLRPGAGIKVPTWDFR